MASSEPGELVDQKKEVQWSLVVMSLLPAWMSVAQLALAIRPLPHESVAFGIVRAVQL